MEDWLCFVFKYSNHHYLVPAKSEIEAWKLLSQRQSCRLEIVQKQYKLLHILNSNQNIIKL